MKNIFQYKLKHILVFFFFCIIGEIICQAPPSASLSNFGVNVEGVPNLYSGGVIENFPLYRIKEGNLSHNISLVYSSKGSRVTDIGSEVGYGFTLNAGGSITRKVNHLADDDRIGGYYHEGALVNTHNHTTFLSDNADSEPDIYYVNTGNLSFIFTFDGNGNPTLNTKANPTTINKSNYKIDVITGQSGQLLDKFVRFEITDNYGTKYYFGQDPNNQTELNQATDSANGTTGWYLYKIESFDNKNLIEFVYADSKYSFDISDKLGCSFAGNQGQSFFDFTGSCSTNSFTHNDKVISSISCNNVVVNFAHFDRLDLDPGPGGTAKGIDYISIDQQDNHCIKYDLDHGYFFDGAVESKLFLKSFQKKHCIWLDSEPKTEFKYYGETNGIISFPLRTSKSIDHWGYFNDAFNVDAGNMLHKGAHILNPSFIDGGGQADRDPNLNATQTGILKEIIYPTSGSKTYIYELNQWYGTISNENILYLRTDECGSPGVHPECCGNFIDEQSFTLTSDIHNSGKLFFSIKKFCTAYNGAISSIQIKRVSNNSVVSNYSIATSNYDDITLNLNTLITNPVIGAVYSIRLVANGGVGTASLNFTSSSDKNNDVGGLRVKSIYVADNISNVDDIETNFIYEETQGISSGKIYFSPIYGFDVNNSSMNDFVFIPFNLTPMSNYSGSHIGYSKVTEIKGNSSYNDNIGKIEYEFFNDIIPNDYPLKPILNDFENGQIEKITIKNRDGDIVKSQQFIRYVEASKPITGDTYRYTCIDGPLCSTFLFSPYDLEQDLFRYERIITVLDGVETETEYGYFSGVNLDKSYQIQSQKVTSGTIEYLSEYEYTFDYQDDPCIKNECVIRNLLDIPYKVTNKRNSNIYDGDFTEFAMFASAGNIGACASASFPRPHKKSRFEINTDSQGNLLGVNYGNWELYETIESYDINGFPNVISNPDWDIKKFYTYDNLKRLEIVREGKTIVAPDDLVTQYTYYNSSNYLNQIINTNEVSIKYGYDELGKLKTKTNECNGIYEEYTYSYNLENPALTEHNKITKTINYSANTLPTLNTHSQVTDIETISFIDGLGRTTQVVEKGQAPSGINDDIIHAIEYDKYGRKVIEYLPYLASNNQGKYVQPQNSWGFNEYNFGNYSPISRPTNVDPAGALPGSTITYESNNSSDVVLNMRTNSPYSENELFKVTNTDGNGNKSIVFTDNRSRKILERKESTNGIDKIDTYYVYDDKDRLMNVVPPLPDLPPGSTWNDLPDLLFEYTYYKDDRLKQKKIPDSEIIEYSYNTRGLLSLYNNGKLRSEGRSMAYDYDDYGRETKSGFSSVTNIIPINENYISPVISNVNELTNTTYGDGSNAREIGMIVSTESRILGTNDFLTMNYNYDFVDCGRLTSTSANNHLNLASNDLTTIQYDKMNSVVKSDLNLSTNTSTLNLKEEYYLDHGGRQVQYWSEINGNGSIQHSQYNYNEREELITKFIGKSNGLWLQTVDYTYTDWGALSQINGGVTSSGGQGIDGCSGSLPVSNGADIFSMSIRYDQPISYDDGNGSVVNSIPRLDGNISSISWKVPTREAQTYVFEYDYLDRLKEANYLSANTNLSTADYLKTDLYSTSYTYDDRGNILSLKRNGLVKDISGCYNTQQIDDLTYVYQSNTNKLNGVNDNANNCPYDFYVGEEEKTFGGIYSAQNQLTSDVILDGNQTFEFYGGAKVQLNQGFKYSSGGSTIFKATSSACINSNNKASKEFGFLPDNIGMSYIYDQNGNTLSDPNKNVTYTYNHLNLVENVSFDNNNSIEFKYSAEGTLLYKIVTISGQTSARTDYLGKFEFQDNQLTNIYLEAGKAKIDGSNISYEYSIADHLGNTRVTFSDLDNDGLLELTNDKTNTELFQEYNYYPFGLKMSGPWVNNFSNEEQYQYNGMDWVDDLGLNINMTTYRNLDPSIGRWYSVDPVAGSLYSMSPYQAMGNNPILYGDPEGDFIPQLVGGIVGGTLNVINNFDKILTNPVSAFGYAATGIGAGVVATLPGGLAASRAILAGGNVATDIASGNIPNFENFGDVATYASGTLLDSYSTGGAARAIGNIAKSSLKNATLKAGKEFAEEGVFNLLSEEELAEMTLDWYGETIGTGISVQIKATAINRGGKVVGNFGLFVVSSGLGIHGNSVNSTRPTQVYEHTFESGKTYTGVGDVNGNRASQSARRISRKYNDPLVSTKTTNLPTRSQAYGVEQVRIEMNGGPKNFKRNYNRRNSPGLKIIKKLFR